MNTFKIFLLSTLLVFSFSGCQGNNSDSPESSVTSSLVIKVENPNVTLTNDAQTETVNVLAFENNQALETGTIVVEYPKAITDGNVSGGLFTTNEATIVNGKASFIFNGPSPLAAIADQIFTFKYKENQSVSAALTMQYSPDLQQIASLAINEVNTTISQDRQLHTVTITALDTNGNFVNNGVINVKFPSEISNGTDLGTFTSFSASIVNGQATFSYTGPKDLVETSSKTLSETFTFTDAANTVNTINWRTNFRPNTPTLRVENPTIVLTNDSQAETVTVLAFDSNNQAFKTGTIIVNYPTSITNGSVSGGTFTTNEATIVNGKATFIFNGPASLTAIANQVFTFKYKENQAVSTKLTVKYSPPVVDNSGAIIVLPVNTMALTTNSQVVTIEIKVFDVESNPFQTGTVERINPSDVLSGRDVGTFDKNSADVVNGVATFVYTGPKDLSVDPSNISFKFYHSSDPTNAKDYTVSLVPEVDQIVLTSYTLKTSSQKGVSMGLNSTEAISYTIYDSKNKALVDADVNSITTTIQDTATDMATLSDTFGNTGLSLTSTENNSMTVNLNSKTKSGIIPIKVDAVFTDVNGEQQTLSEIFEVLVLSGPPTAISMSYASTENVPERAKFIDKWVLTVTDKYNNLVNTNPSVSMGMIAGYAQSSAPTKNIGNFLHYAPFSHLSVAGDMNGTIDASTDTLKATADVFSKVDDQNDVLVIYGEGYTYDVSGKWDITTASANTLNLIDGYDSENRVNMGFAVGNNKRQDRCDIGQEWVGNVYSDTNSSTIEDTGTLVIDVEYDYYLTGKDVMLWVNLVGAQNSIGENIRLGEAKKVTLRGKGLDDDSYAYGPGFVGTVRFNLTISDTVEFYKNANFGYSIENTGKATTSVTTSMSNGTTSCINSGVAYIDVSIDNSGSTTDGQINISKVLTSDEF